MKHKYSKKFKKLLVCISCVFIGCTSTYPFLSYATTQDDLNEANSKKESYEQQQADLSGDVNDLNKQLSATGEKIASLELDINAKQQDIDDLNQQLAQLSEEKDKQYNNMKLRIKFMYEHSSTDTVDILFSSDSLSDLLVRSEYIKKISDYDRDMLQELEDILTETQDAQQKLTADLGELNELKANVENEQNNIKSLLAKKQEELNIANKNADDAEALALKYEQELEDQRREQERKEAEQAKKEAEENQPTIDTTPLDHDATDLELLAAIIECEAGNQPYRGMLAVGSVVINRVRSNRFANSISGVIYSPSQFSPVASGRFAIVLARGANPTCVQAANEVLNGNIIIGALFFHVYHSDVDTYGTVIGDHIFY